MRRYSVLPVLTAVTDGREKAVGSSCAVLLVGVWRQWALSIRRPSSYRLQRMPMTGSHVIVNGGESPQVFL